MGTIFGDPVVRARSTRQLNYLKDKKTDRKVTKNEEQMQIDLCQWLRDTLPDVTIYAARRGYHGLLLELKADGVSLKMKRDGTKIRVRKDSRGRIIERDYKIRKKGDWASLHIEKQANKIVELRNAGYLAMFAVGIDKAKEIVAWYFDFEIPKNESLF